MDVFASTVGGAKVVEPASDLAVAVALASATAASPRRAGWSAMGEIGLAGELRRVRDLPQRLAEAARLGFQLAVVPSEPGRSGAALPRVLDGRRACGSSTCPTSARRCGCSTSSAPSGSEPRPVRRTGRERSVTHEPSTP